ncbi:MAG: NAD(P)/FAD-dependent oxidoreductase [Spirochaetes bacterium]|nr:MAG: NAD(P)/FAD-dependent oxidoreductase [Spirochaetota bacterium]
MDGERFDVIVIGAGSAGITAARLARGLGRRVALVEKSRIGGECTWSGCVPSKALIRAARAAREAGRSGEFGPAWKIPARIDASGALRYVRAVVERVYEGEKPAVFEAEGIRVIQGAASFTGPHEIAVDAARFTAKKFIIATGSRPLVPPVPGLADTPFLTNETVFALKKLPRSMIVLGGGPIGVELAQALGRLGVKVTVVEMAARLLPREEPELADLVGSFLRAEGVGIMTSVAATGAHKAGNGVMVEVRATGAAKAVALRADTLLVAVGRVPVTDGLGLEHAGVKAGPRGIQVDARMQTSVSHIYACGDAAGPYYFSHMAGAQAVVAARNALIPVFRTKMDYSHVPWITFCDPELARSGLTEDEARAVHGPSIRVYRHRFEDTDRGKTDGVSGMAKFILDKSGRMLGIHILGPHAGEILHQALLAKSAGMKFSRMAGMVHAYPSYSDVISRPSKQAYVDELRRHPAVRLIGALASLVKGK